MQDLHARIRLQRAGRLGSAYIEIDLHYLEPGEEKRIDFSGDVGAPYALILARVFTRAVYPPPGACAEQPRRCIYPGLQHRSHLGTAS